jgi:hypothetical protein
MEQDIKEDFIELDIDLNLLLTQKVKIMNCTTIGHIFEIYLWILCILGQKENYNRTVM